MASRSAQASAITTKKRKHLNGDHDEPDVEEPLKVFKSKVLILASRGVTYRMRHLMNDIANLVTHGKKDAKLDSKHSLPLINELADLHSCNHGLYFEARRHTDLYLWASRCPNGPSIRFHVVNSHTMDEIKMSGNCLKGSRPILNFSNEFNSKSHLKLCRELLTNIFAVPKTARKAKPFVDHIISFSVVDGKIWFRNYQMTDFANDNLMLTEIGPRFVLTPIKIFEGSFSGPCIWENKEFEPPIQILKEHKAEAAAKYIARKGQESEGA
ncbi:brix domain-containing protein 2 [Phakopsora pachyrhizi]|nr:brix domain-containing protein 2 [Phakopsora pachyrhizi]